MLLDVMLAGALGTGLLLGLFELTGHIVAMNDVLVRLSFSSAHLRALEGHWRLAAFRGEVLGSTESLCSETIPEFQPWCDQWQILLADWGVSGSVSLQQSRGDYHATLVIALPVTALPSSSERVSYHLSHRWTL